MFINKSSICYFYFLIEHDQITAADAPLNIQQKTLPGESVSYAATLMDKNHVTRTLLQLPCTRMLHSELSSSFPVPKSSCVDAMRGTLSLAEQLMHKNSAKYFSENEDTTSDHPAIIDMSRSLQDISDNHRFSDSNISSLHKKHALQASLTTDVTVSQASHIDGVEPINFKSISLPNTEGMYDYTSNVTLPRHIISKG